MGVPSLYNYLTTTYKITTTVQKTDVLYLDFNAIIHNSIRTTEDTLFKNLGDYLDLLIEKVEPKIVYISVDGRAPVSKVYQQRCRRHLKGGKLGAEDWPYIKKIKRDDAEESSTEVTNEFDSNCITPGTPFMDRMNEFMDAFITKRLNSGKYNQLIIFSSSLVKGEGEQKILQHLNTHSLTSSIYSPDADLLFLTLQAKNTYVIREPHARCSKCARPHKLNACSNVKRTELTSVDINTLKKHLVEDTTKFINFQYADDRILADICFVNFLCGNDFVPRLLCFDVRFDGVGLLLTKLGKYYRTSKQYIVKKRKSQVYSTFGRFQDNKKNYSRQYARARDQTHEVAYDPASVSYKANVAEQLTNVKEGYKSFSRSVYASNSIKPDKSLNKLFKDKLRREHLFEKQKENKEDPFYIDYGLLKGFLTFLERDEDYLYLRKVGLLKSMRKRFNLPDQEEIDITKQEGKHKYYKEKLFRVIDENDSIIKKKHKRDSDSTTDKAQSTGNLRSDDQSLSTESHKAETYNPGKNEKVDEKKIEELTENQNMLFKENPLEYALTFESKDLPLFDNDFTELRMKAGYEYLKALTWITTLYLNNRVASWSWYYPYHYPPLISDLLLNKDTAFDFHDSYDLSLLQQAVAVLPSGSRHNLPAVFHGLLKDYSIEIDMFDKLLDWQGVPLIPFCELNKLHEDFNSTTNELYNRCYKTLDRDGRIKTEETPSDKDEAKSLPVEYIADGSDSAKSVESNLVDDNLIYANNDKKYYFDSIDDMRNYYLDICYRNTPGDDILYVHKSHPWFSRIKKTLEGTTVDIEIGTVEPYCYGVVADCSGRDGTNGTMTAVFKNKERLEQ